ncbi:MAG: hypothetical protein AAFW73_27085, partial [Bacteroidota bacterium]
LLLLTLVIGCECNDSCLEEQKKRIAINPDFFITYSFPNDPTRFCAELSIERDFLDRGEEIFTADYEEESKWYISIQTRGTCADGESFSITDDIRSIFPRIINNELIFEFSTYVDRDLTFTVTLAERCALHDDECQCEEDRLHLFIYKTTVAQNDVREGDVIPVNLQTTLLSCACERYL